MFFRQLRAQPSVLHTALRACRRSVLAVAGFSLFVNLLLLAPSLYMLQVYDRVLASRSESTLLLLTVLIAGALLVLGALEWIAARFCSGWAPPGHDPERPPVRRPVRRRPPATGAARHPAPPRPAPTLRQFIASGGLTAFFDIPWLPVYMGLLFLLDPLLGWLVTGALRAARSSP